MRKIKQLRIEDSIPYPYEGLEVIQLGIESESNSIPNEPLTVVFRLLPHAKSRGQTGLLFYINEDHISIRVSYMGSFKSNGGQTILHNYVPDGSPVAPGPLLQDTAGYIKIRKEQLPLVQEVFNRGDYLGIRPWTSNIYLGVDKKNELMLLMNLIDKLEIQLVAVPGTNTIPPMPSGDGRTKGFKQLQNGIHNGVKLTLPAPVKRYTHTYVTDANMRPEHVHQPGEPLGF